MLTRSAGAVANALDKLVSLGAAELACDKPRSYRLAPASPAPAPEAAGDPGTSAEATASAAECGARRQAGGQPEGCAVGQDRAKDPGPAPPAGRRRDRGAAS